jgi:hypothetical protein
MYYEVKIKEAVSDTEKGVKYETKIYLIEADSTFEAETVVHKEFDGLTLEWEIIGCNLKKISEVILKSTK